MKRFILIITLQFALYCNAQAFLMLEQQKMNVKASMRSYALVYHSKNYLEYQIDSVTIAYHFERNNNRLFFDPVWICNKASVLMPQFSAIKYLNEKVKSGIWIRVQDSDSYKYYTGVFLLSVTVEVVKFNDSWQFNYFFQN